MPPPGDLPFTPNFHLAHSVLLNVPLNRAFTEIGTEKGLESTASLSPIHLSAKWKRQDTTTIPAGASLAGVSVIDLPARSGREVAGTGVSESTQLVHRHWGDMAETVSVLFGLVRSRVDVEICISYLDSDAPPSSPGPVYTLYENKVQGGSGIRMWRLRAFEEVEDTATGERQTRVTEECYGWAPWWARRLSQKVATEAHRAVMDAYHTLF